MLKVGLTGNYGMGKSSVSAMFRQLGAITFDADEIVAGLLKEEKVINRITALFGAAATNPDGSLDKKYVAAKVFSHAALRKKIEALLHPLVFERLDACIARPGLRNKIVIVEVPLLFEGGSEGRFDRTITVYANRKSILERLRKSGIGRKDAVSRLKAQMDIRNKIRRSDYRIINNGAKRESAVQVRKIYRLLEEENRKRISMDRRRS